MIERRATYRIQLSPSFTFAHVASLSGYLHSLGVSHVHLSPCLESRTGSPHGYDVVDPSRVRAELGGREGLDALAAELASRGIGIMLDIVPNHMAAWHENPWWWDVLLRGEASRYAHYFDIDWHPERRDLDGKVLLPFLATPLEDAVAQGLVRLEGSVDGHVVRFGDRLLPIAEGTLGGTTPRDLLELLGRQHYVLSEWRRGAIDCNYRRFANIFGLIGMRVEDCEVFEALHSMVFKLIGDGVVHGLRIDHVDGLRDPAGYFARLRARAPDAWIVAEKVLMRDETLRRDWNVDGTTGYDALNHITRVLVDGDGQDGLDALWRGFTGELRDYYEIEREKRLLVLDRFFAAELNRLSRMASHAAAAHERASSAPALRVALRALVAVFPVYRTYARPDEGTASVEDASVLDEAIGLAARELPNVPQDIWVFLRDLLLLRYRDTNAREFVARFQQLTGPVAAKGVEDTAFYCFNRLTCLNEVGGDPGRLSETPEEFHAWCGEHLACHPTSLSVVSTHDAKRSADVRARIGLLSEMPEAWSRTVERWSHLNERHRTGGMPDRKDEFLIYQTLVGTWPMEPERVRAFAQKAAHEAKRRTAWVQRDEGYDAAVDRFVDGALSDSVFRAELDDLVNSITLAARVTSLTQTLLHMTAAGPPQIYQGDEVWFRALADPDNRRAVDFESLRRLMRSLDEDGVRVDFSSPLRARLLQDDAGVEKLRIVRAALEARRRFPEAFGPGSVHVPLRTTGEHARRVIAFERRGPGGAAPGVVVIAPRLMLTPPVCEGVYIDLPDEVFENAFDHHTYSGSVCMVELFWRFPFALLLPASRSGQ
jgi:(1->4)-alpha-D-glucan 1-alpha-D-glucosylmutase